MNRYYELFKKNFPYIVRNEEEALRIINNPENHFIDVEDDNGSLIATSIIHKNTILMLCVNLDYQNKGIGSKLLEKSEKYILEKGYDEVSVGVGDNYLMPGIPMATKPFEEQLKEAEIYKEVNNNAYDFFLKRGYFHAWTDANCFDMRADLTTVKFPNPSIGDVIDGVTYRFATLADLSKIIACTDDAHKEFSQYYMNEDLYLPSSDQKVLIATIGDDVCGTLMISIETEAKGLGSVGCTAVAHRYRGKHIAVNMVVLGTKYLQSLGLKKGYLGYTYSGLDKMYGYAGYKICLYYCMGHKKLKEK